MPQLASDGPTGPNESAGPVTHCPHCGGDALDPAGRCSACHNPVLNVPRWALHGRDRRFFTRRRLVTAGIILAAFLFILWLNYPFLPNYRILLFNKPSSNVSSASAANQWSMAGGDLTQRKVARTDGPAAELPAGRLKWSVPTGDATRSGPVVAGETIYLGGHFKILALDTANGALRWEQPATGPVQSTPAVAGDKLYVGLLDHRLLAMDAATGKIVWEFRAGDIITAAPVVRDGIIYAGAWDGVEYALDAATGDVIWAYQANDSIGSPGPIRDGVMAVGDRAGRMHLLNPRTGQNRLIYRTPKSAYAPPVIAHDLVFFAAGGRLYAIDANEKEIPGQYQFKRVWAQLWLWQVPGIPRPAGQQGGRWRFSPDGADSSIVASPAVGNTRLFVGDLRGRLYAINPLSGKEQWRFQAQGGIYASPVIVGSAVLFATQEGYVYSLNRESGEVMWRLQLDSPVNEPLAFAGGVLYARTADGQLHAIE